MEYEVAIEIAEKVKALLLPHCERIEIAGSVRRKKPNVKDIEIVAIPKPFDTGLFESGIATVVNKWQESYCFDYTRCYVLGGLSALKFKNKRNDTKRKSG